MKRQTLCKFLLFATVLLSLAAVGTAPAAAASPDKHPFGLDDYSALHRARAVAVSPDGKSILFQVSYDGDKGPTKHEWHLIDASGENNRKLELPDSFEPAGFAKDGTALYGSYEVEKKGQLGIVPLGESKPTRIIALPNGIGGILISPDGSKFAFTANPRTNDPLAEMRHVSENDVTSVYVAAANGGDGAWWCPELKDITDSAWSSDSAQLAIVTQLQKIGHHDVKSTIWVCGSGGAHKLTDIPNSVSGIAWANGGKDLAFASTTTDVLTPDHLWTVPASGGTAVDQTPSLRAASPVWRTMSTAPSGWKCTKARLSKCIRTATASCKRRTGGREAFFMARLQVRPSFPHPMFWRSPSVILPIQLMLLWHTVQNSKKSRTKATTRSRASPLGKFAW